MFIAILKTVLERLEKKRINIPFKEDGYFDCIRWDDVEEVILNLDSEERERILNEFEARENGK